MSHVCYLNLYRGSCRICVICICIGAHVACVLFVFVGAHIAFVSSSLDRVKPKTIKLVFVASPLSMQH